MNQRKRSVVRLSLTIAELILGFVSSTLAQSFVVIHDFTGVDGANPQSGLTIDGSANLYGTTRDGGRQGLGTVFKLVQRGTGWILTPLYTFSGGSDGAHPVARVGFGPDGSLYGSTLDGGTGSCGDLGGDTCGTVFKLRPGPTLCRSSLCPWTETILYRFPGNEDGGFPEGDLTFDAAGNLYGTAVAGGQIGGDGRDAGVVYRLTPSNGIWTETVVVDSFSGSGSPTGGVIFDNRGNLYGTTSETNDFIRGNIFELVPTGTNWTEKVLHTLQLEGDSGFTYAGLIRDPSGNLYGATSYDGPGGSGQIFELTPSGGSWMFNYIYTFSSPIQAWGPYRSLVMDQSGVLYGTTYQFGAYGYGSIFKLSRLVGGGWAYTSLYDFTGGEDGGNPISNVIFDDQGNLYGTASTGGSNSDGVVWEITP